MSLIGMFVTAVYNIGQEHLAQAIELAHSRDARLEEMMAKFEQLMMFQFQGQAKPPPDIATGNPDTSPPTTPDRPPTTGVLPPKQPNTNSSPQRNIYSILRQPANKPKSLRTRKINSDNFNQSTDELRTPHTNSNRRPVPTDDAQTEVEGPSPTTPERPDPASLPPAKKQNQNSSPHRNIYTIFRQQQARNNSTRAQKSTGDLLTQPMETDEEPRQPLLGAKPSNKSE